MADVKNQGLVSLDDDEWAVAEGECDVRGWNVVTADQKKIGGVEDLLADPTAMKVRYITVDLDDEVATGQGEDTIRIPISRARIDERDRAVVVDFAAANLKSYASAPSRPWKDDQQWKALRTTNALERINEEFRRRTKTQASLPGHEAVVLLLFGLLRSGQVKLRALVGYQDLAQAKKAAA